MSADTLRLLERYSWPGNVRELENVLSRSILKASAGVFRGKSVVVTPLHLGGDLAGAASDSCLAQTLEEAPLIPEGRTFRELVEDFEKNLILRAVARNHGNWAAAARDLGMHRSNLHNLASRLGIRSAGSQHKE